MHIISVRKPSPEISPYIRFYAGREARLPGESLVHPLPARSMHAIVFLFGDRYTVWVSDKGTGERAQAATIVGVPTHQRVQLLVNGNVDEFAIFFHGAGLKQLFGAPVRELTDRDYDAHSVLGKAPSELAQRLGECSDFEERTRIANEFFLQRSMSVCTKDPIAQAALAIVARAGHTRVDTLAQETGLSMRQFQRRFSEQVGVPPKLYARIARFESALECKASSPKISWTSVAHKLGYHDQMHMVHDFDQLSGKTPTEISRQLDGFLPCSA